MSVKDEMENRLQAAFEPTELEVVDDSDSHRGHAGHDGKGESHFNVRIRAAGFAGQNRVQRHRMVHKALGDIVPRIHALALDIDV
ncbi:BolA family transcriptional regulator [Parasedimentitalea maritima]|uniref:BolA/IbaG family iron-sulfur metabolism protein n=2 Tax=Parasedimentitalea TaxID=2738399 RepID=A0A6L6WD47_9RHOB|nr:MULTISPECIES: BolA family protein [Zongyanglinia]KAE9629603.1 BolA/IbaG family iron-sulfur metabolism protein [Zongyanglinia marina]MVO15783.1 BolA/IbaG family iron-sulfur metabolism protein [Zongyanglinia huanghaiensis]TLP67807.1 BolA family transcriptional regulator [Zongyanglinia marina]